MKLLDEVLPINNTSLEIEFDPPIPGRIYKIFVAGELQSTAEQFAHILVNNEAAGYKSYTEMEGNVNAQKDASETGFLVGRTTVPHNADFSVEYTISDHASLRTKCLANGMSTFAQNDSNHALLGFTCNGFKTIDGPIWKIEFTFGGATFFGGWRVYGL